MVKDTQRSNDLAQGEAGPVTPEQKQELLARYNEVVDRAALGSIRLLDLNFAIKPDCLAKEDYGSNSKFAYGVSTKDIDFDSGSGRGGASFTCEATSSLGRVKAAHCKAVYYVSYRNMTGCEETATKAFMGRVGRFTCYPYFRALLATLDWSATAKLPTLPVLRERPPGVRGGVTPE